jgi:hypothetical protein
VALYTVHVPSDAAGEAERADRTVFVRDGFNVWGFLFGWPFLLWHRLWAPFAAWLVLACAAALLWWALGLPTAPLALLAVVAHLFIGVEGNDLRRWALERRGYHPLDVVSAARREEAEYAFFLRQPDEPLATPLRPMPHFVQRELTPSVIGMFPDEGMA